MKYVEMTPLHVGEHVIPGGWKAWVPEVVVREEDLQHWARYYQFDGYPPHQARAMAERAIIRKHEAGWIRDLRRSLVRWAQIYLKRFGDLQGFDPERMQQAYYPGENTGRRGKAFVNQLMREMRETVK